MCVQKVQHVSYFPEFIIGQGAGGWNKNSKFGAFKKKGHL